MAGRGIEDIENKGVKLINGSDHTFSTELPKIEEYIKEKIQQEFIDTYEGTKPSLDDLYKFIDRGIKFLLFKYTDKDDTDKLKTIYNLTDADIIKLKNGKLNTYGLSDSDVNFIYNNKTGLSGVWQKLEGLWFFINGFTNDNVFEKLCDGKTWLVIDKYFAQFMFFTKDGIMKFSIFADPSKINFDFAENKRGQELSNDADIYIRFDKTSFISPYVENFNELFDKEHYVDRQSMQQVVNYMLNYYKKKNTKFIALLGKARFWVGDTIEITSENSKCSLKKITSYVKDKNIKKHIFYEPVSKTAAQTAYNYTKEIVSGLLFRNCNLGIVTGGYSGIMASECGITRTGYEIAKHYEKPVVTIMCNAGRFDRNRHSDVIGYYGMHWGDDTKALSSFADGAIMIAPFGAWSQVELFMLSHKKKPCAIYLDDRYINAIETQIKQNEAKLQLGEVTNLQDIFLPQKIIDSLDWEKKPIKISIGEQIVKDFGLGGADQFGLNILLKDLVYNKGEKEIKQTDKMQSIVGNIDEDIRPLTIFYPHYIKEQNETNGIPIFINYRSLTKYITNNLDTISLEDKKNNMKKIQLVKDYIPEEPLTLNRKWEKPFNYLTGSYSPDTIDLNAHTE